MSFHGDGAPGASAIPNSICFGVQTVLNVVVLYCPLLCREVDLTDCTGITDAALLELSKYQRAPQPEADGPIPRLDQRRPSGSALHTARYPVPTLDDTDAAAVVGDDDGDELQFDMEAASTPAPPVPQQQQRAWRLPPSGTAGAALSQGGSRWNDDDDDDDDDDLRQAKLASLAQLASSPVAGSNCTASAVDAAAAAASSATPIPSSSPPSALMAPDRALGSQMARLGLGSEPRSSRHGSAVGSAGSRGWVGSWERAAGGGGGAAGTSATASSAIASGGSTGGSPEVSGTSPGGGLLLLRPPPRMSTAAGPGLRSLVLAGCSQISGEGMRLLLAAPGRKACLESLDISRCPRMTRQALLLPPAVRLGTALGLCFCL